MHEQHRPLLFLIVAASTVVPVPLKGQRRDNATPKSRIEVGTSLDDAKDILAAAEVQPGGLRAFAAHPSGDQWLFFTLRQGKVELVIRFSPRTRMITNLKLYYLADRRSKTSDIAVGVSAIQFYPDHSYAVWFPPPPKQQPSLPQPANGKKGHLSPLKK